MNILLGAHGTGKTTLTKSVKKERPDLYVTDGFSRPAKKVKERLQLGDIDEQILINEFTKWGYKNYITQKNVLSTRSIIDSIIYTEIMYPGLYVGKLNDLFDRTHHKIDNIFYIPIEFDMEDDGVRLGKDLQQQIDKKIKEFIDSKSLEVIVVNGTVQERTDIILDNI